MIKLPPIGVSGLARSGKDSFADALITFDKRFSKDHFAADLKRIALVYLGWDGNKDGADLQSQKGRRLLQLLGTECGRTYCDSIWIDKVARRHGLFLEKQPLYLTGKNKPSFDAVMSIYKDFKQASDAHKISRITKNTDSELSARQDLSRQTARIVLLLEFFWDGQHETPQEKAFIDGLTKVCSEYDNLAGLARFDISEYEIINKINELYESDFGPLEAGVVIPDVRFPNELSLIAHNGGVSVRIYRPGIRMMGHASETSLNSASFDVTVINDVATMQEYCEIVREATTHIFAGGATRGPAVFRGTVAGQEKRLCYWKDRLSNDPDLYEDYLKQLSVLAI